MLQQWARQKYGIRLLIVVIPHTFGRHLNFNCHLHILVSEGGLREDGTAWRARARLDRKVLMPMWRYAVITLLREAARAGILDTDMSRRELLRLHEQATTSVHLLSADGRRLALEITFRGQPAVRTFLVPVGA